MTADFILSELHSIENPEKALFLQRFFKTGVGQYAEGDLFLGIVVPLVRSVAKVNKTTPLSELQKLIKSKYHEARFCALLIVVEQFKRASLLEKEKLYSFYLKNTRYINNWDLVDVTCPHVVGSYLLDKDRSILYELAKSENLWDQRIAMVSTIAFIRKKDFTDSLQLAEFFLMHKHDLMHKAVGWMLREIGKKDRCVLTAFIDEFCLSMPRTTLRYAIEHYPEEQRQDFLQRGK